MIHISIRRRQLCAGLLSLALLWSLSACGPSASEETAVSPTPQDPAVQTAAPPAVSSPVETAQGQAPSEGEDTSPDAEDPPASAESPAPQTASVPYSEAALEKKLTDILNAIITDGMSKRQQARAVFKYVNGHIRFVGNTDKSDWQKGAYEGLTLGRGDCFTYYAASRALLTALEIDNLEVRRSGGTSDHWWNLVNCGDGWYHFDTCPRNVKMEGFDGFMFTDEVAAAYSSLREDIPAFYSFDPSLYPERAGGSAPAESPAPQPAATPDLQSPESPAPAVSQPADTGIEPSPSPEAEAGETAPAAESTPPAEPSPAESLPPAGEASEEPPFIPVPEETEPPPQTS